MNYLIWVLRTEIRFVGNVVCFINHWAISSLHTIILKPYIFLLVKYSLLLSSLIFLPSKGECQSILVPPLDSWSKNFTQFNRITSKGEFASINQTLIHIHIPFRWYSRIQTFWVAMEDVEECWNGINEHIIEETDVENAVLWILMSFESSS